MNRVHLEAFVKFLATRAVQVSPKLLDEFLRQESHLGFEVGCHYRHDDGTLVRILGETQTVLGPKHDGGWCRSTISE